MGFLSEGIINFNFRKAVASQDQITKKVSPFQFLTSHDNNSKENKMDHFLFRPNRQVTDPTIKTRFIHQYISRRQLALPGNSV